MPLNSLLISLSQRKSLTDRSSEIDQKTGQRRGRLSKFLLSLIMQEL
jgi:hypothetical protein